MNIDEFIRHCRNHLHAFCNTIVVYSRNIDNKRRQQTVWRDFDLWYMWIFVSIKSYRFWRILFVAIRFLKSDERFSTQLHSNEKHRLKRTHFDRYCCLFHAKSKSVQKNENFIEIDIDRAKFCSHHDLMQNFQKLHFLKHVSSFAE